MEKIKKLIVGDWLNKYVTFNLQKLVIGIWGFTTFKKARLLGFSNILCVPLILQQLAAGPA
jgi:hypothetical protein